MMMMMVDSIQVKEIRWKYLDAVSISGRAFDHNQPNRDVHVIWSIHILAASVANSLLHRH